MLTEIEQSKMKFQFSIFQKFVHANCASRCVKAVCLHRTATTLPRIDALCTCTDRCDVHVVMPGHARHRCGPTVLSLAVHKRMVSVVALTLAVAHTHAHPWPNRAPAPRCTKAVGLVAPVPTCGDSWPRDKTLLKIDCADQASPMSVSVNGHERQYVNLLP